MIRIDRSLMPSPFRPEYVAGIEARVRDFFLQPPEVWRQQKAPYDIMQGSAVPEARNALRKLFRDKCAYCESPTGGTSSGHIDRFRPRMEASDLAGKGDPGCYLWLIAEWENLYLSCAACSRSKRSLFPVEGPRAALNTPIHRIRAVEKALIVDPCWDEPEDHFIFGPDGIVQAITPAGEVSIKVLSLNRVGLVEQRIRVWNQVVNAVATDRLTGSDEISLVRSYLSPSAPYLATARAALTWARANPNALISRPVINLRPKPTAEQVLATDEEAFRLTARPLRRVRIKNLRALRDIQIDFGEPGSERAPWLAFLGENAVGKSTVLQGIALALAGAREARRLIRPSSLLSAGASTGSIMVWFWDQDTPAELHFDDGDTFSGTQGPSAIVLGYGALRYAERRSRTYDTAPQFSRVAPLFGPIARIRYAGAWLANLDPIYFDTAARALESVLPSGVKTVMTRRSHRSVQFDLNGHTSNLAELSAGYQTIIGLCADLMRLLFERWDNLSSATAIVLIDELDAHLHPQWSMRIVSALREAFPQVQFIVTTHDPLTLRGLRNGEVALLKRDLNGEVTIDQTLPPIEGLFVDQLLTSRVFGLGSTLEPETKQLVDEFYYLKSLPRTPDRERRILDIRERVGDREMLARSETERLMLEAAELFIQEVGEEVLKAGPLKDATLRRLADIAANGAITRNGQ